MEKRGSICQAIEIRASRAPPKGPAAQSDNRCDLQCKVLQQKSAAAAKRLPHAVINSLTLWPHCSPLRLKSYIHNVTLMLHYRILRDWGTLTVVQHATHKTAHTQDHQATLYLHSVLFCSAYSASGKYLHILSCYSLASKLYMRFPIKIKWTNSLLEINADLSKIKNMYISVHSLCC